MSRFLFGFTFNTSQSRYIKNVYAKRIAIVNTNKNRKLPQMDNGCCYLYCNFINENSNKKFQRSLHCWKLISYKVCINKA